ncbi:MAG: hypothetical protein QM764_13095 [Chitinophagaceae bacterium]
MKPSILLLALTAITVTSCTSAYKAGQTPDDVYFSPQRPQTEYVNAKDNDEDPGYSDDYYGDRYLQMKVKNRYQWSDLDDYYYNDRYTYGMGGYSGYSYYNSLYMNPWSPVSYWNYYYNPYYSSFYNPYYSPVIIVGKNYGYGSNYNYNNTVVSNRPRVFNLNTYNNNMLNTNNYTNRTFNYTNNSQNVNTSNRYNNNYRNTRTSAGDYLRNQFGNNNNSNTNYSNNNSNFNTSNSGGSRSSGASTSGGGGGSSSGGGGSAPVRRF